MELVGAVLRVAMVTLTESVGYIFFISTIIILYFGLFNSYQRDERKLKNVPKLWFKIARFILLLSALVIAVFDLLLIMKFFYVINLETPDINIMGYVEIIIIIDAVALYVLERKKRKFSSQNDTKSDLSYK